METESLSRDARTPVTEIRPSVAPEAKTPGPPAPVKAPPLPPAIKLTLRERINKIPKTKRRIAVIAGLIAIIAIGRFGYEFFTTESTDDSFVSAHVHAIGSRVIGTVDKVVVEENQIVKKGDVLVKIDQRDFVTAVEIAEANFVKAQKDVKRWGGEKVWEPSEVLVYNTSTADFISARATLQKAKLQLEYTDITAPEDGKIGKRSVESGQQVLPGQPLFALVEQKPWITANFKENQFAHIKVGQVAEITVDAIPGHTFKGHVESLAPGSGSTFALLPPDNATGNFTKIVQRIPVRVAFDLDSIKGFEDRISPGMSTEVTVDVK